MSKRITTTRQARLARNVAVANGRAKPAPEPTKRFVITWADGTTEGVYASEYRVAEDGTVAFRNISSRTVYDFEYHVDRTVTRVVMTVASGAYRSIC